MQSSEKISLPNLEKILKHLPDPPSQLYVGLCGSFDYTSLANDVLQLNPSVLVSPTNQCVFSVTNPNHQVILDIYAKELAFDGNVSSHGPRPRNIALHNVHWAIDIYTRVSLTSSYLNVEYQGKEPDFLSKIKEEFKESKVSTITRLNFSTAYEPDYDPHSED